MKDNIEAALVGAGFLSQLYAASVGDGGGPWPIIIVCAAFGCLLMCAACWFDNRR